jgi:DNA-binding PadR family transcriptional regulator
MRMSIRQGLLALLDQQDSYGYQLRAEFEERTGGTWALNIGQVYTTLNRLERDGLVEARGGDDEGRQLWSITDEGRAELQMWFNTPVRREDRPRDELAIKLALGASVGGVDVERIIQMQRTDTLRVLQQYTRQKANIADADGDFAWSLVLDGLIFQAEAEIRWLDHCESRLVRHTSKTSKRAGAAGSSEAAGSENIGRKVTK